MSNSLSEDQKERSNMSASMSSDDCPKGCTCVDCQTISRSAKWVNEVLRLKQEEADWKSKHIIVVVSRILNDYTYYQSVCSCGWSGDYKASKLTAQEDKCPNREEQ